MYKLLYLFVVLYPFLVWPWEANVNISFARSDYLALFTIFLWCGFLYLWHKERFRPKLLTTDWCFLVFICLATASTLFSVNMLQAWVGEFRRYEGLWAWYSYMSLFFFSYLFVRPSNYKTLIMGFIVAGWLSSVYGILQHFGMDFLPRASFAIARTRSFSFFGNPNFFGAYLILVILTGIALYLVANSRRYIVVWFVMTSTAFAALVYTETRGAWLGLGVGIALFTWFVGKKICWKRYVAIILAFVCIFGLIASGGGRHAIRLFSYGSELKLALADDGRAGAGRWYIWTTALPLVEEYFWLGSGPDTFGLVFPQDYDFRTVYWDKAHNEFLQIAITMGVPALLFYLAGLILVFFKGLRVARKVKKPQEQIMLYGLLTACLGYQAHAFFNISTIGVAPFFWVLLGVVHRLTSDYSVGQIDDEVTDG